MEADSSQRVTWAHLTLKRLSLLTSSPSLRHPLLPERSNTSHSLRSSGSLSRLTLPLRSGHSDMATCGCGKFHHQRVASRGALFAAASVEATASISWMTQPGRQGASRTDNHVCCRRRCWWWFPSPDAKPPKVVWARRRVTLCNLRILAVGVSYATRDIKRVFESSLRQKSGQKVLMEWCFITFSNSLHQNYEYTYVLIVRVCMCARVVFTYTHTVCRTHKIQKEKCLGCLSFRTLPVTYGDCLLVAHEKRVRHVTHLDPFTLFGRWVQATSLVPPLVFQVSSNFLCVAKR